MSSPQDAQDTDPLARHALSAPELKELLAREREGGAFLAYRNGGGALRLLAVGEDAHAGPVTIGRRPETDIALAWDEEVSGVHAELHTLAGELTIVDDGLSRNGTYVNGVRIGGRQRLRDGDRIRVGRTVLAYRAAQATLVGETVLADERSAPALTDGQRRVLVALCRPFAGGGFATPATNQEIAAEVFLSVDAVKMHLRALFGKFELSELPQNQKRARLAELALQLGAISRREIE
jgi:pSer/pThr/pTyr-binding forkhead associated (FHA) protein